MDLKQKLTKKLKSEFPRLASSSVELITIGYDHNVLVLDSNFAVRFAIARLDKESFIREVKFLKRASDHFAQR